MQEVTIRRALESDSRAIYDLAMEPSVRANSTRSASFTWEEHQRWWDLRFHEPTTAIWVATLSGYQCLIGQIRYGVAGDEAEIAVSVLPGWRRRGIAGALLRGTMAEAVSLLHVQRLTALILLGNGASEALFRSCGFRQDGAQERMDKRHSVWRWP